MELFEFLADKGYIFGTDFIVGHPMETQEFWENAMKNIDKFQLTHIHSFSYSKRDGTPSATMPSQVSGDIVKKRLKELDEIIRIKNQNFRAKKQPLEVLIESKQNR